MQFAYCANINRLSSEPKRGSFLWFPFSVLPIDELDILLAFFLLHCFYVADIKYQWGYHFQIKKKEISVPKFDMLLSVFLLPSVCFSLHFIHMFWKLVKMELCIRCSLIKNNTEIKTAFIRKQHCTLHLLIVFPSLWLTPEELQRVVPVCHSGLCQMVFCCGVSPCWLSAACLDSLTLLNPLRRKRQLMN